MKHVLTQRKFLLGFILQVFLGHFASAQSVTTFSSGAYLVNMGATPQTLGHSHKPNEMVNDLVKNYNIPVNWVTHPSKGKDGVDFSHNGVDYRGSVFIIPAEFRNATVNARIAYWQGLGVVGQSSVGTLSLPVVQTPTDLVISNIVQPRCNPPSDGSLLISGLPATGTWTLYQTGTEKKTYTGTGTTFTVTAIKDGVYRFCVENADGCKSNLTSPFGAIFTTY